MRHKSFLVLLILLFTTPTWAQWYCEPTAATNGDPLESNAVVDAVIIWVAVAIVVFTLFLSIKFLVKPEEKNPNHIKNIIKDEGLS
ncbi:hypothetical protein ACFQ3R_00785 [Mesonia ostreae]|uniref:CcmD family protein n=1 Tax=Mesonia ostreae TaxID=861110 RepID=A0ABU2KHM8_9FLAO|nr:hypothetical protein [Mesonia ostreae]MDT0294216.1 hypothetical protein [Mesonia ostreae]